MSVRIAIILCTYNGDKYLEQQLNSIINQTYKDWVIYASDDNSNDRTLEILLNFQNTYGHNRIIITNGPNKNNAAFNFLFTLNKFYYNNNYFAFCDQDDIWHKDKLERAIAFFLKNNQSEDTPKLFCSSTRYISKNGEFLQNSYIFKLKPNFKNALVQSIAGGNTMLFNKSAAKIILRTNDFQNLVAHDWWLYILVSAYEGVIFYDKIPTVDYRQHNNALVGENRSILAKVKRIRNLLNGRFKSWTDYNLKMLNPLYDDFSSSSKQAFDFFKLIKCSSFIKRIYFFYKSGIRRQTLTSNIALFLAVIIKRF